MVITLGGACESCQLRTISDIELKFLTIKPIHKSSGPKVFCKKKCSQKFSKTDGKKHVPDTETNVFLSILQNFQEQFFCRTPPAAVYSSFKATGFVEAVMQTNF